MVLAFAQGSRNVNVFGGAEFNEAPPWLAASGKFLLKIENSTSLEMAISEFYQRLFERSISSLISPCVHFLMP